ncbi:MAG: class I SAM-dependent methyltransferase [Candidatus Melainabacteria bacterium]|nr:class I SAM-dependent methyltransferase [Candidatus Melainabacteria bacterium]
MDSAEYKNIFESEDSHFYYQAVHNLILTLIEKHASSANHQPEILEAGCGTGLLSVKLKNIGNVSAIDMHDEALRFSQMRGVNSCKASVEALPFPDASFDIVTSVDVIYHRNVLDDSQALREFRRVLKAGGTLVMRVPARQELHSTHDETVWTSRRYRSGELRSKLEQAHLQPLLLSYCHSILYGPAFLKARLEKAFGSNPHSGVSKTSESVNNLLIKLLATETKLIASGLTMPIGLGLIAVARAD